MSIYVTGDVHGYPIRLVDENLNLSGYILTEKDKLIICEDFGLPWYGDEEEAKCIAWLGQKPFEILFVDGNHENHYLLSQLPEVELFGGTVGKVCDSVYHLKRGEIYTIDGKKFFCFGGAKSTDKEWRVEGLSWWPEEMPSKAEMDFGLENLIH